AQLIKPVRSSLLLETLVSAIQKRRSRPGATATPLIRPTAPMPAASVPVARPVGSAEIAVVPERKVVPEPPKAVTEPVRPDVLDILVAEDNEVNQLVFSQILVDTPHRFHIVGNGQLAVEAYREMKPRMILMDVSMPGMNGLEATGAIRELEAQTGRHVPIVGVTAHALKGDRERCIEAGMDDYLSKPISPKALLEKVETWVGNADAAEKRQAG